MSDDGFCCRAVRCTCTRCGLMRVFELETPATSPLELQRYVDTITPCPGASAGACGGTHACVEFAFELHKQGVN